MKLKYLPPFLRLIKAPGMIPIMRDWQTIIRMHFIYAAYESGLLEAIKTPCNRTMLIEKLQVKRPELLDALLEVGLATKELSVKNALFSIKGRRSRAVINDKDATLAAVIQANVTYYNNAYRHAANRLTGGDLGDDLDKIGDIVARFSKLAEPFMQNFISANARGQTPLKVLDVGCGSGILLRGIHQANRNAVGIGMDMDEAVVRQARKNMDLWGLSDQFSIRHGDIRQLANKLEGPFDLITLSNILYYFKEEERFDLIRNLKANLSKKGSLAIAMNFYSQGKDMGAANLNMANTSFKGLTPLPRLDDIKTLLKQCGLKKQTVHRFMPGSTFCGIIACG